MNYQKLPFTASLLAAAITMTACSGGGNSSNSEPQDLPKDPGVTDPAPALPTYTMNMNGGDGAEGGRGGNFYLYREGTGGAIRISAEASIDPATVTGVSIPEVTADSGSNPLVVSTDLTIDVNNSEPAVGQVYYFKGSLYIYDGAMTEVDVPQPELGTEATVVTGINVAEGATLTFSSSSDSTLSIDFEDDVINSGTITTANSEDNTTFHLAISARVYEGSGDVTQPGSAFNLYADLVINNGTISTKGPTDTSREGGSGSIGISGGAISNTGSLISEGFDNPTGTAGHGANIRLSGFVVSNSGSIDASTGVGANENVISGGEVNLQGAYAIANTGSIDVSGEDGIADADASGGAGGYIAMILTPINIDVVASETADEELNEIAQEIIALYGDDVAPFILNIGSLNAEGGAGAGTGNGGAGGIIGFAVEENGGYFGTRIAAEEIIVEEEAEEEIELAPPARVEITGQLSLNGGSAGVDGYSGAPGGSIYVYQTASVESTNDLHISGITEINMNGGNGTTSKGGKGGQLEIQTDAYFDDEGEPDEGQTLNSPDIVFNTNINSNGGNSTASEGSYVDAATGGYIEIYAYSGSEIGGNVDFNSAVEINSGSVAGNASNVNINDDNAYVEVDATNDIMVSGSINGRGGDVNIPPAAESSDSYMGGYGAYIYLESEQGDVTLSSDVDVSGGNSPSGGGEGGGIYVETDSGLIAITGSVTANGGD
ncbi:MAG: hypothetical protein CMH97_00245, partial [Oceanospirillaceae bacterium]|nr:hypothetical protein [Oceanospirillaceae bacterium]